MIGAIHFFILIFKIQYFHLLTTHVYTWFVRKVLYTSQALFAGIRKHLQTCRRGSRSHCLRTSRAVVLEHSTKFPTWYPGYQNFLFVLLDSDTIRNLETPPEEKTQNVGIFVFERKKLYATASKFEGRWNGTFKKFQPHVIIGFWYFTKQNWRKSVKSRYYFLMIASFNCAYFVNCIILHLHCIFYTYFGVKIKFINSYIIVI